MDKIVIKNTKEEFNFIIDELNNPKHSCYYFGYFEPDVFVVRPAYVLYTSFQKDLLINFFNYLYINNLHAIQNLNTLNRNQIKEILIETYFGEV